MAVSGKTQKYRIREMAIKEMSLQTVAEENFGMTDQVKKNYSQERRTVQRKPERE